VDINKYVFDARGAKDFTKYLSSIVHLNSEIMGIYLYDSATAECMASSSNESTLPADTTLGWYKSAIGDPTVHVFSILPYEDGDNNYKLVVSKAIDYGYTDFQAILKFEMSFSRFVSLVQKSNLGKNGHITIVDPSYNIVYTSLPTGDASIETEAIQKLILGTQTVFINGNNMSINVDTLTNTKWRICVFINVDMLIEIEQQFLLSLIFVSVIVLIVGTALFLYISRLITKPIKQLENAMQRIEHADYFKTEEVSIYASKEVESLAKSFNQMIFKIKDLMDRVVMEQGAQRESELKALQNQINPHFLYNTLDSITWLVQQGKNAQAEEMVVSLARLFRISISKGKQVITVKEELDHVRNYLVIQSIRYSDSFLYTISADENALACKTMKLILQPIVENCIYHGLKNKIDIGKIDICAKKEGEYIVFTIADNGYGMRQEKIDELIKSFEESNSSDGVGLKNIYQRVMLYCNKDASLTIESVLDEGTTITIKERIL
ncbi:MAG: histidine kinase, partial [Clostridia bacterium]